MLVLRDYQQECVTAIWNDLVHRPTALAALSTGSGKGHIIAALLAKSIASKPDIKCLVLFNRVTLLSQLADRFKNLLGEDKIGLYCGTEQEWDNTKLITVGSIQSMVPDDLNYNLIIVDEVHNLSDESGRYIRFIKHQMEQNPKTKVVGFTATPFRSDGYIYGKNKFFTHCSYERGLRFFINNKFLVPPVAKQPDHQIDLSKLRILKGEYRQDDIDAQTMNVAMAKDQVIDALNRAQGRKKVIWFCSSINHAVLIKNLLNGMDEKAVTLHSKMEWAERDIAQNEFEKMDARHLTFVTVVSEGYDFAPIDCVVLMRPTRSAGLLVQVCGRALRPYPGKEDALFLDYGGAIGQLGPLEDPVIGKPSKGIGKGEEPRQKTCPECRTYVAPRVMSCPQCGFNWPKLEATKLSLVADENASLLKKYIKSIEVSRVKMSLHISKAGNKCIKIEYFPKGLFFETLSEYFAVDADFAMRKFILRAIDLGFDIKGTPEEQVAQPITRIPKTVEYVQENKYPKIQRLKFV